MGKIGIMGGTFDPIHNGHLLLGRQAYEEFHLDQVWYMPSGHPPHKRDRKVTEPEIRCQMTKLGIKEYPYFQLSDFEVSRSGNTYTSQTLVRLREAYPNHQFYFIVGGDSLYEIEGWHEPETVLKLTTILVAGRDYSDARRTIEEQIDYLVKKYQANIFMLHCAHMDISSEEIRTLAGCGKSLVNYVPQLVEAFIYANQLYKISNIHGLDEVNKTGQEGVI